MSSSSTYTDRRHQKRVRLVQQLFASTFPVELDSYKTTSQQEKTNQALRLTSLQQSAGKIPFDQSLQAETEQLLTRLDEIDQQLRTNAPERPLADINQVDLAILRVIYWESLVKDTPYKVLIDEAVELAKELGSESSPRFVNGVLGKLLVESKLVESE
jgi:N utilization substance protein B